MESGKEKAKIRARLGTTAETLVRRRLASSLSSSKSTTTLNV